MLIPLKVDVPMSRLPFINYLLIPTIILLSLCGFYDVEFFCKTAGIDGASLVSKNFMPHLTEDAGGRIVAAFGSMFLHGGYIHLLGNIWFLWVFGNAINYKFGHALYPLLFLLAGWVGNMVEYAFSGVPCIGASGAINGVVGAFLVFFPKNEITMAWLWGIWGRQFSLSSYWVILLWVIWDAVSITMGGNSGVALWAHIAGFSTGFVVAMVCAATGVMKPTDDEQTLLQVFSAPQKKTKYY